MDKEDEVQGYSGILVSHRKERNNATWMGLESVILRELSQTENASIMCYHLNVNLRSDTNELTYKTNRLTDLKKNKNSGLPEGKVVGDKAGVWD